jgi:beta-1,4-N-acetylglucosaminyltransferase
MAQSKGKRLTICLTCSHGGHLNEMVQLVEAFAGHDTFYYCYDAPTTRALPGANVLVPNMARNPLEFLRNLWRAWRTFRERRPDLIVSTGAEIAIPLFLVGKVMGCRLLYVECGAQVVTPSGTGRIVSHFADRFLVQWPELLPAYHGRAHYAGSLIDQRPAS